MANLKILSTLENANAYLYEAKQNPTEIAALWKST